MSPREPRGVLRCDCLEPDGPAALRVRGPLVRVGIGPDPDDEAARKQAARLGVSAVLMIDTGASASLVNDSVLRKLGLPPERYEPVVGIFPEPVDCPVYRLSITIPMVEEGTQVKHYVVRPLEIAGLPESRPKYFMGLLGRDCLEGLGLIYDGPHGICFITDDKHVDPALIVSLHQAARVRRRQS